MTLYIMTRKDTESIILKYLFPHLALRSYFFFFMHRIYIIIAYNCYNLRLYFMFIAKTILEYSILLMINTIVSEINIYSN
jgi:hypothetical protein